MSEASNFVSDLINQRINNGLQYLLKGNTQHDPAAQSHLDGLKNTSYNRVDLYKLKLQEQFDFYVEPTVDIPTLVSMYESTRLHALHEQALNENMTNSYNVLNPSQPKPMLNIQSKLILDLMQPFLKCGNTYFPISMQTGIVDKSSPLLNPEPGDFSSIEAEVLSVSQTSKQVHVLETTSSIISLCESRGYSKKDLAKVLEGFIRTHLPHLSGQLFLRSQPEQVFTTILGSVSYYSLVQNVNKAMKNLVRNPGQTLDEVIQSYISLLLEKAYLDRPNIDYTVAHKKASKQAQKICRFLVEPNLASKLDELRIQKLSKLDEFLEIEETLKFVAEMEQRSEFLLRSAKSLQHQPISLSIFHIEYNQDTMDTLVRDFEAHTITQNPTYENLRDRPPSPIYYNRRPVTPNGKEPQNEQRQGNFYTKGGHNLRTYDKATGPYGNYRRPPQQQDSTSSNYKRPNSQEYRRDPQRDTRRDTQRSSQRTPFRTPSPAFRRSPGGSRSASPHFGRNNPQRPRTPSNGRGSTSPIFYRSKSGNNYRRLSASRISKRTPSGSFRPRNRSNPRDTRYQNSSKSPSRGRSPPNCKLCGSSHVTPSATNGKKCAIYGSILPTRTPCPNCKKYYHPYESCLHGPPVRASDRPKSPQNGSNLGSPKNF